MSVKLSVEAANAGMNAITALLNEGALVLYNDEEGEMCTITLPDPAFGAADNGVAALLGIPYTESVVAASEAPGTAMVSMVGMTQASVAVFSASIGTATGNPETEPDIAMPNNVFYDGEDVSISSLALKLDAELT